MPKPTTPIRATTSTRTTAPRSTRTKSDTKDAQVYQYLRRRILRHSLRPGERLREEELCRQLKVTRTPLRLALRRLEHEKLVVGEPFCGCRVREVPTQFRHHVTGGDWRSLRHRARQLWDVARVVLRPG